MPLWGGFALAIIIGLILLAIYIFTPTAPKPEPKVSNFQRKLEEMAEQRKKSQGNINQ
jgi:hypothetical protein